MKVYMIRHFMTRGNQEKRYIGATNEHVLPEEWEKQKERYPKVEAVVVSPLIRCVETAKILYAGVPVYLSGKMQERDFGLFENRNAEELQKFPWYQKWQDSFGRLPFPAGEPKESFQKRCLRGFKESVDLLVERDVMSAAFIVHSGTITSILEGFHIENELSAIENGDGIVLEIDSERWKNGKREVTLKETSMFMRETAVSL